MIVKSLHNRKGQVVAGEYVMVLFLVIAALVSMTFYFKRAVQGRIKAARDYMVQQAQVSAGDSYDGPFYAEYEPYYINTDATVDQNSTDTRKLEAGGSTGIFTREHGTNIQTTVTSETAPPKDYQLTDPTAP